MKTRWLFSTPRIRCPEKPDDRRAVPHWHVRDDRRDTGGDLPLGDRREFAPLVGEAHPRRATVGGIRSTLDEAALFGSVDEPGDG